MKPSMIAHRVYWPYWRSHGLRAAKARIRAWFAARGIPMRSRPPEHIKNKKG